MDLACPHCSGLIAVNVEVVNRAPLRNVSGVELWDDFGRVNRSAKLAGAHLINFMGPGNHSSSTIQSVYQSWGQKRGMPPLGRRNLGRILRMLGCIPWRSARERGWTFPSAQYIQGLSDSVRAELLDRPLWYGNHPHLAPSFDAPVDPPVASLDEPRPQEV